MSGKRADPTIGALTKAVAAVLNNRGMSRAQIVALLTTPEAKAEGLHPYPSGSLGAHLTPEAKAKNLAQADKDEVNRIASRLLGIMAGMAGLPSKPPLSEPQPFVVTVSEDQPEHVAISLHEAGPTADGAKQCDTPSLGKVDSSVKRRYTPTETPRVPPLVEVKRMIQELQVSERPQTAPGLKSTLQTTLIAARFPSTLVERLDALGGKRSHHLEKALMVYLRALEVPEVRFEPSADPPKHDDTDKTRKLTEEELAAALAGIRREDVGE